MEELMNVGLSESEIDMYYKCAELKKQYEEKVKTEVVFAIMGEQVRIASQLIGVIEDSAIEEITGVSISHIKCLKS